MNDQTDSCKRVDQRGGSPTEVPLQNGEKPLHSVRTDEYDGSYRESSPSEGSPHHCHDDDATACGDRISTDQSDPIAPREDESTTRGTEVERNRELSSSIADSDEQEWSAGKPKAVSSAEINQAKWDALFGRLLKYKDEFGDCLVPNRYETDPTLGAWVSTQRR